MTVKTDDKRRQRRVSESIRAELSMLLVKDLNDPALSLVNLTGVEVSPDLKSARVFYSVFSQEGSEKTQRALERAASRLQREIGRSLQMKNTPVLRFVFDATFVDASRIDELIIENRREELIQKEALSSEQKLSRRIADAERILLCVHSSPDADAAGSLLAMGRMLTLMGKRPVIFSPDRLPPAVKGLVGAAELTTQLSSDDQFDVTILMDTGGLSQLPLGFPPVERRGLLVVIDHHLRHDQFGDLVIRREASSVGELLYVLARELAWPVDRETAQCMYIAMVADTGSFRYDNTKPTTHRVAAELIELGASPWDTATALYESLSLSHQKLLGLVALTLAVSDEGKLAQMDCTQAMIRDAGATEEDTEGLANFGRSVDGVEVCVVFIEDRSGNVQLSFRSAGRVDVSAVAAQFGGGGHAGASGATVEKSSIGDLRERVTASCRAALAGIISE